MQAFLPAIPPGSGIAFVIVQHLDPGHDSLLSALLSRVTRLPVMEVAGETQIEVTGLYWHFIDIVWIFLYPLLYLIDVRT